MTEAIQCLEVNDRRLAQMMNRIEPDMNSGCWLWSGYIARDGYGRLKTGGKVTRVHRLSWALHNGPVPDGFFICHRCDTPACANPAHLFLGTTEDNMADMRAKGRQARGEKNGRSKLSTEDVRTIRQLCFDGARQYDVSQQFGIDQSMVSLIAQRRKWAHV